MNALLDSLEKQLDQIESRLAHYRNMVKNSKEKTYAAAQIENYRKYKMRVLDSIERVSQITDI